MSSQVSRLEEINIMCISERPSFNHFGKKKIQQKTTQPSEFKSRLNAHHCPIRLIHKHLEKIPDWIRVIEPCVKYSK